MTYLTTLSKALAAALLAAGIAGCATFTGDLKIDSNGIVTGTIGVQAEYEDHTKANFVTDPRVAPLVTNGGDPTTAIELISQFEGFRAHAYDDLNPHKDVCNTHEKIKGTLTIGFGTIQDVNRCDQITLQAAKALMHTEVNRVASQVDGMLTVPVTTNQRTALIVFAYNVGTGALRASTLLRKLNAGDIEGASQQFAPWVFSKGQKLNGLIKRRAAEAELFLQ